MGLSNAVDRVVDSANDRASALLTGSLADVGVVMRLGDRVDGPFDHTLGVRVASKYRRPLAAGVLTTLATPSDLVDGLADGSHSVAAVGVGAIAVLV